MGRGVRNVHFEVLPGCFCPFMALASAVCMLGFKIQSPGKIFEEGPTWNYLSLGICWSVFFFPIIIYYFWNVKVHVIGEGLQVTRAGGSAPWMEAEQQGWSTLGKSLWEDDEDGTSPFTAENSTVGGGETNRHKLKHGRMRLDIGKKLLSYFPITNYLNM